MEELIKQVVSLLAAREKKVLELTYQPELEISTTSFIHAQRLRISQVELVALFDLVSLKKNSGWVQSILSGLSYGVSFEFQLPFSANCLIPTDLISEWPLRVYDKQGFRLRSYPTKAITYEQIAHLKDSDTLLVRKGQLLSELAKERLETKKVDCIERCC